MSGAATLTASPAASAAVARIVAGMRDGLAREGLAPQVRAAPVPAAARHPVGAVLRYGNGALQLMLVAQVFDGDGDSGPVYYGRTSLTGWAAFRHAHVTRASAAEAAAWRAAEATWRASLRKAGGRP